MVEDKQINLELLQQLEFQNSLLAIAREAGEAIMDFYHSENQNIEFKADNSPVTAADLAANSIIELGLANLTPNILVVSEENLSHLKSVSCDQAYWLIDPLDGTREFIKKNGQFTVNIALIVNGDPAFGVVYVPAKDLYYWGGEGIGAWRKSSDGTSPISVSTCNMPPRIVASPNYINDETTAFLKHFSDYKIHHAGSSVKICMIAEGSADFYPRFAPTNEWDTAAADAVLRGAGGVLAQFDGTPLRYCKEKTLNPNFIGANRKDPIFRTEKS